MEKRRGNISAAQLTEMSPVGGGGMLWTGGWERKAN